MSAVVEVVHNVLVEVRSESSSFEVAVGGAGIGAAILVASSLRARLTRPSSPTAGRIGLAWTRASVVVALFVLLAVQVAQAGWVTGGDAAVLDWLAGHRSGPATALARAVSEVGSPAGTAVLAILAAGWLVRRYRSVVPGAVVLVVLGTAAVVGTVCKHAVARARPPIALRLVAENNFAFPSGHTTATTAVVTAVLAVYLTGGPRPSRALAAVLSAALAVAAVGSSRLYLGVHWLTDVVGGALLGTAVTMVATAVLVMWRGSVSRRDPAGSSVATGRDRVSAAV
ncbi:putative membrane protein [Nocardia nova SH22a]|uniref:Putative membrane protein n=1 Tax=Nocardia nova SH22a TaxID=1415166 RepID=W5TFM9_9NOCA|nr:putative membrane protein [Nocardia nova SH22a]